MNDGMGNSVYDISKSGKCKSSHMYSQGRPEELDGLWCPDAPDEPLSELDEGGPVALDGADHHHHEVRVGEHLGRVRDAIVYLANGWMSHEI